MSRADWKTLKILAGVGLVVWGVIEYKKWMDRERLAAEGPPPISSGIEDLPTFVLIER